MYPFAYNLFGDDQTDAASSSDHQPTQYQGQTVDLNLNLSPPHPASQYPTAQQPVNYIQPGYPPPGQQFQYPAQYPYPVPPPQYGYWPRQPMYYTPPTGYPPYTPTYTAPAPAPLIYPTVPTEPELQPTSRARRSARSRLGSQGAAAMEVPRQAQQVQPEIQAQAEDPEEVNRAVAFERLRPAMRQRLGPQDLSRRSVDLPMQVASQEGSSAHSGSKSHRRRHAREPTQAQTTELNETRGLLNDLQAEFARF
ncbi:PREDICTED: altered inheritance of mitochondria protein 3-like [Ipomoea nil]|uniref:altered inheritance of mitochondria protein 3-like n=1 Tax=Ipomoea nil TaxID=35883 RepID=UPI000901D395|nr:PREDICTED: altered inheritance of mitochondria protein 3-like [Ipomoea nil]